MISAAHVRCSCSCAGTPAGCYSERWATTPSARARDTSVAYLVLRDALAQRVGCREIELSFGVALLRGLAEPAAGLGGPKAAARSVGSGVEACFRKLKLPIWVSELSGFAVPVGGRILRKESHMHNWRQRPSGVVAMLQGRFEICLHRHAAHARLMMSTLEERARDRATHRRPGPHL